MNLRPYILAILFLSFFLETTVIAFPFVFIAALILYILYPDMLSIIVGFFAGLILDSLKLTSIGVSSLVILVTFALIEILKRVLELKDYKFVILLVAILSFIFARTFSYMDNLLVYSFVFAGAGFLIYYFHKKSPWLK